MSVVNRALPVLIAAVLVAALLLGFDNLHRSTTDTGPGSSAAGQTTGRSSAGPDTADLDRGAVSDADVATCLAPDFATAVADVDPLYGEVQSTPSGEEPVLVLRNQAGDLRLCDAFGGDSPAVAPLPTPSVTDPVAFLSTGRASWQCTGDDRLALGGYQSTSWLAVAPTVHTIEQRYVVDGSPGEWFSTTPRGGYAHLHTWIDGPLPAGTTYAVQWRVLDADGHPVQQSTLPTARTGLSGCTAAGSAQIG